MKLESNCLFFLPQDQNNGSAFMSFYYMYSYLLKLCLDRDPLRLLSKVSKKKVRKFLNPLFKCQHLQQKSTSLGPSPQNGLGLFK